MRDRPHRVLSSHTSPLILRLLRAVIPTHLFLIPSPSSPGQRVQGHGHFCPHELRPEAYQGHPDLAAHASPKEHDAEQRPHEGPRHHGNRIQVMDRASMHLPLLLLLPTSPSEHCGRSSQRVGACGSVGGGSTEVSAQCSAVCPLGRSAGCCRHGPAAGPPRLRRLATAAAKRTAAAPSPTRAAARAVAARRIGGEGGIGADLLEAE